MYIYIYIYIHTSDIKCLQASHLHHSPSSMSHDSLGLLTPMRAACLVRVSTKRVLA